MNAPVPMPVVKDKVRFVLYWTSYFLSMAAGLISAAWQIIAAASPDVTAPLWVKLAPALLLLVVAQLNGLAGNNVVDAPSVVVRRDENGAAPLALVGVILIVAGLVVWFATTAWLLGVIMVVVGLVCLVAGYSNRVR
jgi:hypothetical protein